MTARLFAFLSILALCLIASASAQAAAVTWDLENVVFNDGGTASGSFVFDTSTDTYLSWNITTTATTNLAADDGFGLNGTTYTTNNVTNASSSNLSNASGVQFRTANGSDNLDLVYAAMLTSAGGTINVTGSEGQNRGFETRTIASGEIVSAVPLPASVSLFALAAMSMVFWAQHKKVRARI